MTDVEAAMDFVDFDGVLVTKGTRLGELMRTGYSENRREYFWNTRLDGKVTSVTVGRPPVVIVK